jgi:hypothetical protein
VKLVLIVILLGLPLTLLLWPPVDAQGSAPSSALIEAQDKLASLQAEIRAFKELLAAIATGTDELDQRIEALRAWVARDTRWAKRKVEQISLEEQALLLRFGGLWESREAIEANAARFRNAIQGLLDSGEITSKRGWRILKKLEDMARLWEREQALLGQMESSLAAAGSSLDEASNSLAEDHIPQALSALEEASNRLNDSLRARRQSLPLLREIEGLFADLSRDFRAVERLARIKQARRGSAGHSKSEPKLASGNGPLSLPSDFAIENARVQLFDLQGRLIADEEVMLPLAEVNLLNLIHMRGLLANGVYLYVIIVTSPEGRPYSTEIGKLVVLKQE